MFGKKRKDDDIYGKIKQKSYEERMLQLEKEKNRKALRKAKTVMQHRNGN